MTPPAWSSLPETGLNFTSTKPSLTLVSSLIQTGKVASPDCLSTFGLLGAVSSFSTVQFAVPLPVFVAVQPDGDLPVSVESKLMTSAFAESESAKAARQTCEGFMSFFDLVAGGFPGHQSAVQIKDRLKSQPIENR